MELECKSCLNKETFYLRGILHTRITDTLHNGEIELDSNFEADKWVEYDSIECAECGAIVYRRTKKKVAELIIRGAYRWLKENHLSEQNV